MPDPGYIPCLDETIVCIVDRENIALAAVISSYFSEPGKYFPLFTFPGVKEGRGLGGERMDDDYIPQMVGRQAAIELQNILAHIRNCRTLVLAGLSDAQRSYIDVTNIRCDHILEVTLPGDVDSAFRSIGVEKSETLRCRPDEVLRGLHIAKQRDCRLWIAGDAESLPGHEMQAKRLIIVEQTLETAGCVIAVNYAHSIGAEVRVVSALPPHAEARSIRLLQRWRENNDLKAWEELSAAITDRVKGINFGSFEFVNFFTEGLPYSLAVNAAIPSSYVHLGLCPDRLIVNAILREREKSRLASAVVFAIEGFYEHDETFWLIDFLQSHHYAVRQVIGPEATVEAFDYHAADYPYDLFHVSSHGGEVDGSRVSITFASRDGHNHVIEYDEVVGIAPTYDGSRLFSVQQKALFRSLDGLEWASEELRERDLPQLVYVDAEHAIFDRTNVVRCERREKERVPGGCAIVCSDGYHMAMFRTIASYGTPVIFNNTCSSWSGINHFFLGAGAIAYIGTHWNVPDALAIDAAEAFYENATQAPLMYAIHAVNLRTCGTVHANIYAFWGLHFSTFTLGKSVELSVNDVGSRMARLIDMYVHNLRERLSDEVRKNAARTLRRVVEDFDAQFTGPSFAEVKARADAVLATITPNRDPDENDAES